MEARDTFLWVEKYRPQKIDDCILPESLKKTFYQYIATGELPNFLFSGSAGVGKTTVAKALCNEVGAEYLFVNGSEQGGIDMLRTTIKQFASTVSFSGGTKVVILDEADYLTPATQPALRGFMEEFSDNCRFILTCNYKNRVIEPLHSRCAVIDFKIDASEKPKVASQFFRRVVDILGNEGVEFDQKVVAALVERHFPDFRRVLNELQRYSVVGKIDSGVLANLSNESFKELMSNLKTKNFPEVRKWVGKNNDMGTTELYRQIYDTANDYIAVNSLPNLVLILADYQYKAAFVADHEVNNMACLTEIMAQCNFK